MDFNSCPSCGAQIPAGDDYCSECGSHRLVEPDENYCTNPTCDRYKKVLSSSTARYCGKCGEPTVFGKQIEELI